MIYNGSDKIIEHLPGEGEDIFILQNGTKLGEVFEYLPSGIINKTITGIGATTLELQSKRNSIIVEPLRVTASAKATKHKGTLYVGSPIGPHKKRVTAEEIQQYASGSSTSFRKIIVVADSLPLVIRALGASAYASYFLMIDEADSFQYDSTFRSSMEICLDYYKLFPVCQRALVTATPLKYSEPELQREHQTTIKYETPTPRTLRLTHSDNVPGTTYDVLLETLKSDPSAKIVVAYNYVDGCLALAEYLKSDGAISEADISILCSANNRVKTGIYYRELDCNHLPTRICFLTSAYFTGLDIDEEFHLISVSNPEVIVSILSEHKLKQIAGRARAGLLSEHVIYGTQRGSSTAEETTTTVVNLIEAAETEMAALKCLEMNYEKTPLLRKNLEEIRTLIVDNTRHSGFSLLRIGLDKKPCISYFNIDACLEAYRVRRSLYDDWEYMKNLLEETEIVHFEHRLSKVHVQIAPDQKSMALKALVKEAIANLETIHSQEEVRSLINASSTSHLQQVIYREYLSLMPYIDRKQLLNNLYVSFSIRDRRKWKRYKMTAAFALLDADTPLIRTLRHYLNVGDVKSMDEIKVLFARSFQEVGLGAPSFEGKSGSWLVNCAIDLKKHSSGDGITRFKITAVPSLKVHVLNTKPNYFSPEHFHIDIDQYVEVGFGQPNSSTTPGSGYSD